MVKKLLLRVKRVYFDAIKSGQKKTEFRDCTEYWANRLIEDVQENEDGSETLIYNKFSEIIFTCGKDVHRAKHLSTVLNDDDGIFEISFS